MSMYARSCWIGSEICAPLSSTPPPLTVARLGAGSPVTRARGRRRTRVHRRGDGYGPQGRRTGEAGGAAARGSAGWLWQHGLRGGHERGRKMRLGGGGRGLKWPRRASGGREMGERGERGTNLKANPTALYLLGQPCICSFAFPNSEIYISDMLEGSIKILNYDTNVKIF